MTEIRTFFGHHCYEPNISNKASTIHVYMYLSFSASDSGGDTIVPATKNKWLNELWFLWPRRLPIDHLRFYEEDFHIKTHTRFSALFSPMRYPMRLNRPFTIE